MKVSTLWPWKDKDKATYRSSQPELKNIWENIHGANTEPAVRVAFILVTVMLMENTDPHSEETL